MIKRWITAFALLIGLFGIIGLAGWNLFKIREAAKQSHERWVQGLSKLILAERRSLTRWIDQFPTDAPLMSRLARANPAVDAIFLSDHESHDIKRWVRPSVTDPLEKVDPR